MKDGRKDGRTEERNKERKKERKEKGGGTDTYLQQLCLPSRGTTSPDNILPVNNIGHVKLDQRSHGYCVFT